MQDRTTLARQERAEFVELLEHLTPQQWDAPTLCPEWRVRHVVAHVFSYDVLTNGALIRRFLAGRLNGDRVNAIGVAAYAGSSTDELLALAKEHLQPRGQHLGGGGHTHRQTRLHCCGMTIVDALPANVA